ncbi:ArsC family transcriptional regulator [Sporanaerobium hydrogeniformans]|uniref:ArsC family transcriptional regulator n=1 Tax=Sporanaerobium hydrogeniformans TaxID=3072179 RepID=A0AC61DBC5_9FIRM|nr:arsenate reductase family protein [Sporanaerobium hydrogeniformans]PHV69936.1 ArsC family transcriptional regulator [Sporanaerobium hydrogeniformans]
MNIQIFGTKKCFDTKKAERYFKERGIKYQFVDLKEKGLSQGELNSIKQAVGGIEVMIDKNCRDKEAVARIQFASNMNKEKRVLEYPVLLNTPIVRNAKQATIGYKPEVWKDWE